MTEGWLTKTKHVELYTHCHTHTHIYIEAAGQCGTVDTKFMSKSGIIIHVYKEGSKFGLDWICLTTTHVLQDILAVLHK